VIVVKIGGGGGVDLEACCADVARLYAGAERVALVHGGSAAATRLGEALGHAPRFLTAPSGVRSRYTDARTLEVFTLALGGVNAEIVARLQARGVDALGLSGIDGRVLEGRRKEAVVTVEDGRRRVIRDDRSGTVERVNAPLLRTLLESGYVPVLSPPALSPDGPINVDADRASALVASALGAHTLIVLTNVPGLLRDPADPTTLVPQVRGDGELEAALELAASRMRIKLLAARAALHGGVARVVIADGRRGSPVSRALDGEGTIVELAIGHQPPVDG
jgi:acetylglutamate/LysW-gamma-L-alpha-aminoadipate kinase